jgi:hypothetical protein
MLSSSIISGFCLEKKRGGNGVEVDERIKGKVAGLSRHPQKEEKKGVLCLVQSARGREVLAGRFCACALHEFQGGTVCGVGEALSGILYRDAVFSVDALCKCGKL